ncbi:MAG: RNA methyltransferase [Clostridia bacterium]|nr:RNA methyltransferase [Clostridia bacterium]
MPCITEIHDLSMPELQPYAGLTQAQLRSRQRPEQGLLIAESVNVILAALEAGYEPVSLLMERRKLPSLPQALLERCAGIPLYVGGRELLAGLTGYELTRGVLCALRRRPLPGMRAVCEGARRIAVLESMTDTTNMGAVFRSAAALGMDAVLLTPDCCDPLSRRAARVSMGGVFRVPWTYITPEDGAWPAGGIACLHEMGFALAALALRENALPVDSPALKREVKLAVVLGTEGSGLREETIAQCDYAVIIPMSHGVDSLNVAAAGAVAFWELGRMKNRE